MIPLVNSLLRAEKNDGKSGEETDWWFPSLCMTEGGCRCAKFMLDRREKRCIA